MTKTNYTTLDAAIIEQIKGGADHFHEILGGAVRGHANVIAAVENARRTPSNRIEDWRIVDRRLQALRKAGHIRYTRQSKASPDGGWVVSTT